MNETLNGPYEEKKKGLFFQKFSKSIFWTSAFFLRVV